MLFPNYFNWLSSWSYSPSIFYYGLPLALIPVLIHMFNRLRHRRIDWAAMMFLRIAAKKNTRYAKIRQYLVLLTRVLAVLALLFALSRPHVGGWMSRMFGGDPETILLVMDRSVSMEARDGGNENQSKLEAARDLLAKTAKDFPDAEIWYLDPVEGIPRRVENLEDLETQLDFSGTDTGADIPTLLETAGEWLKENKSDLVEVWIASDMQQSNWQPGASGRWAKVSEALGGEDLPFTARVQLMAKTAAVTNNFSLRVLEARQRNVRLNQKNQRGLELVLDFNGPEGQFVKSEITYNINGRVLTPSDVQDNYRALSPSPLKQSVLLPLRGEDSNATGWGYVQVGPDMLESDRFEFDDNPRDNRSYFVYGPGLAQQRMLVVGPDNGAAADLRDAAHPRLPGTPSRARVVSVEEFSQLNQSDNATHPDLEAINQHALVLWHGSLPGSDTNATLQAAATKLEAYVAQGGVAAFFPSGESAKATGGTFAGFSWDSTRVFTVTGEGGVKSPMDHFSQALDPDEPEPLGYRVKTWKHREGPLRNTRRGRPQRVNDLVTIRRNGMVDHGQLAHLKLKDAAKVATSIVGGDFTGSYNGAINTLQDGLREVGVELGRMGGARWTAESQSGFDEQLAGPVSGIDPGKGETAREEIEKLQVYFDYWLDQLASFEAGAYVLASYDGGDPLLARQIIGRGEAYFFTTRPDPAWSNVQDQFFFVVMAQEFIRTGSALGAGSFSVAHSGVCGAYKHDGKQGGLEPQAKESAGGNFRRDANVYRSSKSKDLVALNRPAGEDETEYFNSTQEDLVKDLFGRVPVHVNWESATTGDDTMQGAREIWRWFLVAMVLVLVGEAILVLPRSSDEGVTARAMQSGATAES